MRRLQLPVCEPGRILVLKEKHGRRYFDASTLEKLHAAALWILKERMGRDYGYFGSPGKPADYYDAGDLLSDEQISKLPTSAVQNLARVMRTQALRHKADYEEELQIWKDAKQAKADKNGALAWLVLQKHMDHEYEGFCFEYLEDVK